MRTLTALLFAGLTSCGHIYTDKDSYKAGSGVKVNGATVSAAVNPEGSDGGLSVSAMIYMAGGAKLKGPFAWRIEAEGQEGVHTSLIVHRVKVTTSKTNRSEWFPAEYMGQIAPFKSVPKEEGVAFAAYKLPGTLEVDPTKDGAFTVTADVTVRSKTSSQRKLVQFTLAESREKDVDFIFLPAEIVNGWKPNPRDWDFGDPL